MLTCSDKRGHQQLNTDWLKSIVSTGVPCGDHIHRNPAQRRGSLRQNCHTGSRPPAKTHTSQTAGSSILQPHHKLRGTTGPARAGECHYLRGIICHSSTELLPLCLPHPSISLATEKTESNSLTVFTDPSVRKRVTSDCSRFLLY